VTTWPLHDGLVVGYGEVDLPCEGDFPLAEGRALRGNKRFIVSTRHADAGRRGLQEADPSTPAI
jgi:hypothetical protein